MESLFPRPNSPNVFDPKEKTLPASVQTTKGGREREGSNGCCHGREGGREGEGSNGCCHGRGREGERERGREGERERGVMAAAVQTTKGGREREGSNACCRANYEGRQRV